MQAFLFYCLTPFKGKVPRDFFTVVFRLPSYCNMYTFAIPPSHTPCNPFCFTASRPLKGKSREISVIYLRVRCLRACFAYRPRLPFLFKLCSMFFSLSFIRHFICSPLVNSLFSLFKLFFFLSSFLVAVIFLYLCHFYVYLFCKKCCYTYMSPLHAAYA